MAWKTVRKLDPLNSRVPLVSFKVLRRKVGTKSAGYTGEKKKWAQREKDLKPFNK